jgi:dephospho-CoA kinase
VSILKVALTGGIATGKTYVLEQFRKRGVSTLDADALARGATTADTEGARAIAARFGPDVMTPEGEVDRRRLASIVFADPAARHDLEAIVHPAVYRAIAAGLRGFELLGYGLTVVDVPLLYETSHASDFDRVIVTVCPPELQIARLASRGVTEAEAWQRIRAQLPTEEKAARADFVVRTDGALEETDRQVETILETLRR